MLTSETVKDYARECGADLVGIGSMDRFEGAPKWADPRYVFPDARAIIALAFRIPRGYLRGIEEGTHFYQYPAMGYSSINEVYAPMVLRELACFLEDEGYEGGVWRNTGGRGPISDLTGDPQEPSEYGRRLPYVEPVSPEKPAPDVFLHFRIAAYTCGLGEIGYSKVFLTPEFGPRQRFAFMFTDAPLEPDPIYDGPPICDQCKLCATNCPGHAISKTETVTVTVAGRELSWGEIAEWQCFYAYMGGVKEINPFLPKDAFDELPDGDKIMRGEKMLSPAEVLQVQKIVSKYCPAAGGYYNAMCAGRGCLRACMVHLEEQGKTTRKFHQPFRTKKPWRL